VELFPINLFLFLCRSFPCLWSDGRKLNSGMIEVDPLEGFELGQPEQAAQVRFDELLIFRHGSQTKRDAGGMDEHTLRAQINPASTETDPMFDIARATEKVKQRFLV